MNLEDLQEYVVRLQDRIQQREDRIATLERALKPFCTLKLGPQGYCSEPILEICREARAALESK